jgi:uncharacterized protein (DUF1697 family)
MGGLDLTGHGGDRGVALLVDRRLLLSSRRLLRRRLGGPGRLARAIEEGVAEGIGVSARVIVRREDELGRVVAGNPFVDGRRDPALLHVTFSAGEPDPQAVRELAATSFDADEVHVAGREVYLHCPNGYGRSKLSNAFLERKLGVVATTRSWKTVTALAEMARGK